MIAFLFLACALLALVYASYRTGYDGEPLIFGRRHDPTSGVSLYRISGPFYMIAAAIGWLRGQHVMAAIVAGVGWGLCLYTASTWSNVLAATRRHKKKQLEQQAIEVLAQTARRSYEQERARSSRVALSSPARVVVPSNAPPVENVTPSDLVKGAEK